MATSDELLHRVTKAIDRLRRELDRDTCLRQVRIVVRRTNGNWVVQIERQSEEEHAVTGDST